MNPINRCIQKISPGKHFSYARDRTYGTYVCKDVRTRVMLYAPPIINGGGIKTVKDTAVGELTPHPYPQLADGTGRNRTLAQWMFTNVYCINRMCM